MSVKRIGDYLQAPEIETFAIPSKEISFESTSIAWPSDDQLEDSDRFVLRDLNFKLPKGELSVIFGQTGSGKIQHFFRIRYHITSHLPPSASIC